jgi:hypothetical protein
MLEHTSRLAEKLATSVSRRQFLGGLGRWAGAMSLAMAGVLAAADFARASTGKTCCECCFLDRGCVPNGCVDAGDTCPPCRSGFPVQHAATDCGSCKK